MSVVEKNDSKLDKKTLKLFLLSFICGVIIFSIYSFFKSDTFQELKAAVDQTKEAVSQIKEKKQEIFEAIEAQEEFEPYEREEDKGFAYDDFDTNYDY